MANDEPIIRDGVILPPKRGFAAGGQVKNLIGQKFGMLTVMHFAGFLTMAKDKETGMVKRAAAWCCKCDCGALTRVPGFRLLGTSGARGKKQSTKSCGCLRRTNAIARNRAAPKEKAEERCRNMRASRKERQPAFSMDGHRAAELLGVPIERIHALHSDKILAGTFRRGELWVSSADVSDLLASQEKKRKQCRITDSILGFNDDWKSA